MDIIIGAKRTNLIKSLLTNFTLFVCSVLMVLVVMELLSRWIVPITFGTKKLDRDGKPVEAVAYDDVTLIPGLEYRQVSSEFNGKVTITDLGHRIPRLKDKPDTVFIGDSFTFGVGLSDEETFAYLYNKAKKVSCANLGRFNTGTHQQLDILEYFLKTHQWRPHEVKLFFFGMVGALMSGNDLRDNLVYQMGKEDKRFESGRNLKRTLATLIRADEVVLKYSNLARWIKFKIGPWLKSKMWPNSDKKQLSYALESTRQALSRLDKASHQYRFNYKIYVIHPIADLLRGTHGRTVKRLFRILPHPGIDLISTADLFNEKPTRYYFSSDGHINSRGSKVLAQFLIDEDITHEIREPK